MQTPEQELPAYVVLCLYLSRRSLGVLPELTVRNINTSAKMHPVFRQHYSQLTWQEVP